MEGNTEASSFEERRAYQRTGYYSVLSVKIVFASHTPSLLGVNLSGHTVDISASGLGITLNCEVPIKSNLDLWVTLHGSFKKYYLSGKVQWCRPTDEAGMYAIGIALHERTDTATDFGDWRKEFDS